MSILATLFALLSISQCSSAKNLFKTFLLLFTQNCKSKKTNLFQFLLATALFITLQIAAILLANTKKSLKSVQSRGGVEDTRLEAKAKVNDTKKIRGQGQPFRGQTLSRPRTGMLEAKAKDQGHKRSLHKNFSGDLQKKKKKKRSSQKFFKQSPQKNVFQKIFQPLH